MLEDNDLKTVNQIETVVEEEENIKEEEEMVKKEEEANKEDIVTKDEIVKETPEENPVVTVEAVQGKDIKETTEDIKEVTKDIKEADKQEDVKNLTNESASSDILTNQRPAEVMEDKDDPPPPYQLLSGKNHQKYDMFVSYQNSKRGQNR